MAQVTLEQTLALAGVCQACHYVQTVARKGQLDSQYLQVSLSSVLQVNPESVEAVYDGNHNLENGLKLLVAQLSAQGQSKDTELTRYVLSVLTLERKLNKHPKALNQLAQQIEQIEQKLVHYELTHDFVIEAFADAYKTIISPLGPRIQVLGNPNLLQQKMVQSRVRALLMAAIRSAVLWRQLGGKRRNIIFQRQKYLQFAMQAGKQI
ncbi:high frequency lysogenization protein HflD [Gayadomonas joobiniege]|uniref:high frequency lysogenization protein HflD n=1 Tax=Gayadomonas joobiniege TaxID=1234606 RepID=UPI00035F8608|nr:high frequency lysogenization protein HflD [Gayadomonas joobiniege]